MNDRYMVTRCDTGEYLQPDDAWGDKSTALHTDYEDVYVRRNSWENILKVSCAVVVDLEGTFKKI